MAAIIVGAGGVSEVNESITLESLGSTADALDSTDRKLADYGDELKGRILDWSDDDNGGAFDAWNLDDISPKIETVDIEGRNIALEPTGSVGISSTIRCRGVSGGVECESEGDVEPTSWARAAVDQRASIVAVKRPVVVHGFVVEDSTGRQTLVTLEVDPFVGSDSDISSGIGDIALVALPLLLFGLGAITWFSLGRALNPVAAMIDQVDNIGADSLDQRVAVPVADDELKHLATTMNRMLDRLQGANERQRQFISDASHELRSPITATGVTLDVARARPDEADWEHVASVVDEENTRLASLVDDLLLLARMDEDAGHDSESYAWAVDLDEVCLAEAERPHPVEVSVRVIEPVRVTGNTSALKRLVRNLVENATAHAATSVWIEIEQSGQQAIVRVADDGPGVPPEFAEKIFERFVRVDESRVRNDHRSPKKGGAGLGLAIARRVAQNHDGSVKLVEEPGYGAVFELRLPLVD